MSRDTTWERRLLAQELGSQHPAIGTILYTWSEVYASLRAQKRIRDVGESRTAFAAYVEGWARGALAVGRSSSAQAERLQTPQGSESSS